MSSEPKDIECWVPKDHSIFKKIAQDFNLMQAKAKVFLFMLILGVKSNSHKHKLLSKDMMI